jgi:deoxyinosine 3'endonuclease (endonuclease V)
MKVVYEDFKEVELTVPYIPGFLAFREAPHLLDLIGRITGPKPEVILVDGNGILHTRGFGLASHLGVISGIPTIGVGKKVFNVDGIDKNMARTLSNSLTQGGQAAELIGDSGRIWGAVYKAKDYTKQPIIISVGHKVSLLTAIDIVRQCTLYKNPEPVRQADIRSREQIRQTKK